MVFLDAQMDGDGRSIIPVYAFVKTAQVPTCPQWRAEPYAGVANTSVRPAQATQFRLFCGVAIALARMRNHVAVHLQRGEVVVEPKMRGEAEPVDFVVVVQARARRVLCGRKSAPRECPIPGCSATP